MEPYDRLGGIRAGHLLDVGCGQGAFIEQLVRHLGDCRRVTAVDVVPEYGSALRKRFPSLALEYRTMEAERLEFADATFDAASISYALHHVADPRAVLAEMRRVVRPGGWIIVAEPHTDISDEAQRTDYLVHSWRARVDTWLGVRHNQTLSPSELVALVESAGLASLQVCRYSPMDRDREKARTAEQIREYDERLAAAGTGGEALRVEGRILAERLRGTGVKAAPALLMFGQA
jgi:2-polyprenyl-3-methyl-5-hydroxy-6-metoxy-1,4-benzoquinol methylase